MSVLPRLIALLAFLAAMAGSFSRAHAQVLDIQGVKVAPSISIYNHTLLLNGAGVCMVEKNKPYVIQIYAKQKFGSLAELLAAPGPKRLVLTALKETDTSQFVKVFNRNLDNGDRTDMAKLIPGMVAFGNVFKTQKIIHQASVMLVDWIPNFGMTMYIDGKMQFEAQKPPELFQAAMGVWMGDTPIDPKLKESLLGRS